MVANAGARTMSDRMSTSKSRERFKPFYAHDRGTDLGATSWPKDAWKLGGGVVWGWVSYDPELNLIYYGTSNPGPWNQDQRPGDNKWTCAIMARDADTGELRWVYQLTPHDLWDYDGVNENILVDLPNQRGLGTEGARAFRSQRLRVHDRSQDG